MGGRGSSFGGSDLGGGSERDIRVLSQQDLISKRERQSIEVDNVLGVLRDINQDWDQIINDTVVAKLGGKDGTIAMAYYEPGSGVIGVNQNYFDSAKIQGAYERSVISKYHPNNGTKTGLEATTAHEAGHALTDKIAEKLNVSYDQAAKRIVGEALRAKNRAEAVEKAGRISGYAKESNSECIAEAFCDVYCNGSDAKSESKAIVDVLRKYAK